ncbi:AAA family ATPase [Pantoea ananatis]|uniref:AAA family ATPase n=1 Tax=Pantoea ananas TaxID=553 RepID=UPI000E27C8A8|nr:AAA family ATPase [Pantoea ananatis]REE67435.1 plasmid segregation oscillating ATPase ParF [Pantoea ananatis]
MILTIANTKGGVGKSTLAVNLAVARAMQGKKVWLVDGDKQGSSQTAILIRSEADVQPGIACSHYPDGPVLRTQVLQQKDNYDDVIIECGGRDSTAMRAALTLTDYLLVPFVPGSFEAWAMEDVVNMLRDARSIRDDFPAFSILNRADVNPRTKDNQEMHEAMSEYAADLPVLEHILFTRKAFANAAGSGRSVVEMKLKPHERPAKAELEKLISIVFPH